MAAEYTERIELPSKGILYEDIPSEVVIRNITTTEEKMIFGSSNVKSLDKVMDDCIKEPEGLKVNELLTADKHFVLIQLRILTYGSDYNVKNTCEHCGETDNYVVNLLEDMPIDELDEDFVEPFEFELPMCEDTVGLKLLRGEDLEKVEKKAKRIKKRSIGNTGDIKYILRKAQSIVTVNGEELPSGKRQKYVESLHGRDSAYISSALESIRVGYDNLIFKQCKHCGGEMEFSLPMNSEFFRPKFRF
jgi:rRNA maturation protein Nop10